MRLFFDTSVLVPVFWEGHPHHAAAFAAYRKATPKTACCAAHAVAELYAVTTRLPVKPPILPEQAMLFVEDVAKRLTLVELTGAEYVEAIARAAEAGLSGGKLYDALILASARKVGAEIVYTFNLKDLAHLAPELKARLRVPPPPARP